MRGEIEETREEEKNESANMESVHICSFSHTILSIDLPVVVSLPLPFRPDRERFDTLQPQEKEEKTK